MASKYSRKNYYVVKTHPSGRVISRHYKLSTARKVAGKNNAYRVYNQDGRAYL
jgi:hypothetical protein